MPPERHIILLVAASKPCVYVPLAPAGWDSDVMARLLFVLFWVVLMVDPVLADGPWAGRWQVTWPNGGAFLELEQNNAQVSGSYRRDQGSIEAVAESNRLVGHIIHDGIAESFSATLGRDGRSFSGSMATGEWLSGLRLSAGDDPSRQLTTDLKSPRATIRSFLSAANRARAGEPQALAWAVDTIDFGTHREWQSHAAKFTGAEQLFHLVDLATFSLSVIPDFSDAPDITLDLPVLDTTSFVKLDLQRGANGDWLIVMPSADAIREMTKTLENKGPASSSVADGFRQLRSPRDSLRAFLDGMSRWSNGGADQAIATLDIANVADVIKDEQGRLAAQYLVRTIDRIGQIVEQSVPNSGVSREPFVYFEGPAGRIVIEPVGTGDETRWKFSAETVKGVRRLFGAVQLLPDAHSLDPRTIPPSLTFTMRAQVSNYAPALLGELGPGGRVEYWQVLGGLTVVAAIIILTYLLSRLVFWGMTLLKIERYATNPKHLATGIALILAVFAGSRIIPHLGLPAESRQYTLPIIGSVMTLIFSYTLWQLIEFASSLAVSYVDRTATAVDNIFVTFLTGVARLGLIAGAVLFLGYLWSLPTTGIIAGLGVGGLAVAFASRETLANVFGAGILLGDRPFRKGDRIISGDVNGWVEAVGLRSTRVRTLYDSLMIVPNGKLADRTIDNLGARRRRTLTTNLLVTSGSTPERLQAFTRAITDRISSDAMFEPNTEVNIIGIAANGIQIEISASLKTQRGFESRAATHKLFLDILQMAETEGLTLGRGMEKHPVYYLSDA